MQSQTSYSTKKSDENFSLEKLYKAITASFIYKTENMEGIYAKIQKNLPDQKDFFVNWFKTFPYIADFNFTQAKECFLTAFNYRQQMKEWEDIFYQKAFAFFLYIRDIKTAKEFWDKTSDKTKYPFFYGNPEQQININEFFWTQFPPKMFINQQKMKAIAVKDFQSSSSNPLQSAIEQCNEKDVKTLLKKNGIEKNSFNGASPLYYAIQFKNTLSKGSDFFARSLLQEQVNTYLQNPEFQKLPEQKKQEIIFSLKVAVKKNYIDSGLAQIMYNARYCDEEEISSKTEKLDKIIKILIEKEENPDNFLKPSGNGFFNTALYFAGELDDEKSCFNLLKNGADPYIKAGEGSFTIIKNGEKCTSSVPNNFIYRLINFKSWKTLRMYLENFPSLAEKSMTQKTPKFNITPLVFFILNTVYSAKNEEEFSSMKKLADIMIPLFISAGSSLKQNTAFGSAEELLG